MAKISRHRARVAACAALLPIALVAAGCGDPQALPKARDPFVIDKSVTPPLLKLEPDAVRRLELATEPVTERVVLHNRPGTGVGVPYAGLLYKPDGTTFVYLQTAENTFTHQVVTVDHIAGSVVALTTGPAVGARVVTAGAAELWGVEFGVGK